MEELGTSADRNTDCPSQALTNNLDEAQNWLHHNNVIYNVQVISKLSLQSQLYKL